MNYVNRTIASTSDALLRIIETDGAVRLEEVRYGLKPRVVAEGETSADVLSAATEWMRENGVLESWAESQREESRAKRPTELHFPGGTVQVGGAWPDQSSGISSTFAAIEDSHG